MVNQHKLLAPYPKIDSGETIKENMVSKRLKIKMRNLVEKEGCLELVYVCRVCVCVYVMMRGCWLHLGEKSSKSQM